MHCDEIYLNTTSNRNFLMAIMTKRKFKINWILMSFRLISKSSIINVLVFLPLSDFLLLFYFILFRFYLLKSRGAFNVTETMDEKNRKISNETVELYKRFSFWLISFFVWQKLSQNGFWVILWEFVRNWDEWFYKDFIRMRIWR